MSRGDDRRGGWSLHLQRYLIAGIITVIPIWLTWWLFRFILNQLSNVGRPWVRAMARALDEVGVSATEWVQAPWFESVLAIVLTIIFLYLLGWGATRVIGKRILAAFDRLVARIPLVTRIYGAVKTLTSTIQQKPEGVQRVVLIPFPTPEMKTVGFVTRILTEEHSGRQLAAVYVPTTPNPTSGYLEIVPLEQVTSTDWSVDEAMAFIISGGAVGPDRLHYSQAPGTAPSEARD